MAGLPHTGAGAPARRGCGLFKLRCNIGRVHRGARVSGQPYEQYIQEHILDPLGMRHSTVQVPVPPDLRAHASLGYWDVDGVLQPVPDYPEYFGQAAMMPAGGHSSSVTDMARFMIAHLQNGHYSDADIPDGRILKESTMQQMHSTLYTPDSRILGTRLRLFRFQRQRPANDRA